MFEPLFYFYDPNSRRYPLVVSQHVEASFCSHDLYLQANDVRDRFPRARASSKQAKTDTDQLDLDTAYEQIAHQSYQNVDSSGDARV
jgi:hypothetical protein